MDGSTLTSHCVLKLTSKLCAHSGLWTSTPKWCTNVYCQAEWTPDQCRARQENMQFCGVTENDVQWWCRNCTSGDRLGLPLSTTECRLTKHRSARWLVFGCTSESSSSGGVSHSTANTDMHLHTQACNRSAVMWPTQDTSNNDNELQVARKQPYWLAEIKIQLLNGNLASEPNRILLDVWSEDTNNDLKKLSVFWNMNDEPPNLKKTTNNARPRKWTFMNNTGYNISTYML